MARTGTPLGPGTHPFLMHWVVPSGLSAGDIRYLAASFNYWNGALGSFIAEFDVTRPAQG